MPTELQKSEEISLWECLHDGGITSLDSDLMARTLTIVVDSAYHWEFHALSPDMRFKVIGENVRITEAFDFEPWLGAIEPSREMPWEQAQAQRQSDYEKGRHISVDWNNLVADINANEDYELMNAKLTNSGPLAILEIGIMAHPSSSYRTIKIHAEHFHFHVGERELSLEDFQEFGAAYWNDFAQKSKAQLVEIEKT